MFKHFHLSAVDACMSVVILCCMIDLLGLSLTIPILANYARDVQGNAPNCPVDTSNNTLYLQQYNTPDCQLSVASIKANTGLLTTAYAAATLVSTMWMPLFSDKFGPRNAIIVSIFGSIIGFLGQAFTCPTFETSPNSTCIGIPGGFGLLVAVRAIGGLFGGTISVAAAFIVILYPQKQRGQQFAKMSACALSAFVFGPFVGGGLAQFGLRVPLYVAGILSFIAFLLAIKYVVDPHELLLSIKKQKKQKKQTKNKFSKDFNTEAAKKPRSSTLISSNEDIGFVPYKEIRIWLISAQTMMSTLAFNGMSSLAALVLLEDRLGVVSPLDSVEVQGKKVALWVMAYVPALGFTQVFVVMGLFPRLEKKIGLLQTGTVGSFFIAVSLVLIPFYSHPALMFITQVLLALGNGLQTNVSNTYLSKFAPKGKAATTLSYGTMADTVGNIIGPQLTVVYLINATLPFVIAAGFGLCSMIILLVLICLGDKPHPDHDPKTAVPLLEQVSIQNPVSSSINTANNELSEEVKHSADSDDLEMEPLLLIEKQEQERMDAMKVSERYHPACYHTGETNEAHHIKYTTESMSELSSHLYSELLTKNHMWGLRSKKRIIRNASVQANKDMLSIGCRDIPAPNQGINQDDDTAFREGIAMFLSETGHEDWALSIEGINVEQVLNQFRVPQ